MRVGDLLAGTWVISAPPKRLSYDLGDVRAEREGWTFSDAQLDVYGVYELQTLERVLRDGDARAIATVAAAIRAKIAVWGGGDHDFLHAYYDASRARMERGLLFGKRREDKHDR